MGVVWVVVAAVLFGVGSLAQAAAASRHPGHGLAVLVRHPLFLAGTVAELAGAGAHLVALQSVSMAVAQCAVSGSLAVTALGARLVFGARLGRRGVAAVTGSSLALVALSAVSGDATAVTSPTAVEVVLAVAALLLGLGGAAAVALRPAVRGPALAVASGLSFAACSIATRLLDTSSLVAVVTDPAAILLAVTGGLGCLYWTLALRHAPVTMVTAIVVVAEVVPPSLVGPLLGDTVGVGFAIVAPLALVATAAAAAVLARSTDAPRRRGGPLRPSSGGDDPQRSAEELSVA